MKRKRFFTGLLVMVFSMSLILSTNDLLAQRNAGRNFRGQDQAGFKGNRMSQQRNARSVQRADRIRRTPRIPNLTDEQKKQIKELRMKNAKELLPLKNQLAEKKARLRTLSTVDQVKMNEIEKVIDEIGSINVQIMKKNAAQQQNFRKLLTEEQRIACDSKSGRGKNTRPVRRFRQRQRD